MIGILVKNELERLWKEVIIVQFEIIFRNLPGGIEENLTVSTTLNFQVKAKGRQ
jgi:hypothetical protein